MPWVFEKGSKPALIISALEALAVVVALKENYGEVPGESRCRVRVVPTTTDKRGNGAALNKLMTTRYSSSAVLMELAACVSSSRHAIGLGSVSACVAIFAGFLALTCAVLYVPGYWVLQLDNMATGHVSLLMLPVLMASFERLG